MTIDHSEFITTDVPMIQFALSLQGGRGLPNADQHRQTIILGVRSAAGTQTVNTVSSDFIDSPTKADDLAGAGSMAAVMCRRYLAHRNSSAGVPKAPLKLAVVNASSAGAPVAATGVYTFAAGTSTATATWKLKVGGHLIVFTVPTGSNETAHGDALVSAYNALSYDEKPCFTAANAAGAVTFTCAHVGVEGNGLGLEEVFQPSAGVTGSWGAAATASGADGSTPISLTAVLAALETVPGQIVVPFTDDTKLEAVVTHLITKGNATNKLRCRGIFANNDTYANIITWLGTIDDNNDSERILAPCIEGSGMMEAELAAIYAGMRASERHLARSFDGIKLTQVNPPATGDVFSQVELQAILEAGGTPLEVAADSGVVSVVREVACRSDLGIIDGPAIDVYDYTRDYLGGLISANLDRSSIVDDDAEIPPVAHITTPSAIKRLLHGGCLELERIGYLTNVNDNWANVQVELTGSTITLAIPAEMVPQLHGIKVRLDAAV